MEAKRNADRVTYNFKESRAVIQRAQRRAHEEGTQLATVLRRLVRQYITNPTVTGAQ